MCENVCGDCNAIEYDDYSLYVLLMCRDICMMSIMTTTLAGEGMHVSV